MAALSANTPQRRAVLWAAATPSLGRLFVATVSLARFRSSRSTRLRVRILENLREIWLKKPRRFPPCKLRDAGLAHREPKSVPGSMSSSSSGLTFSNHTVLRSSWQWLAVR